MHGRNFILLFCILANLTEILFFHYHQNPASIIERVQVRPCRTGKTSMSEEKRIPSVLTHYHSQRERKIVHNIVKVITLLFYD